VVEEVQAAGLARASQAPWRMGTHTNLAPGFVLARLHHGLESPLVSISKGLLLFGPLGVIFSLPLRSPLLFALGFVLSGLAAGGLLFLARDTVVTLEEKVIQIRNGKRQVQIPRSAEPRLDHEPDVNGKTQWHLVWTLEAGQESRLRLGPLPYLPRRFFALWIGEGAVALSESELTCEVQASSGQRICPLCRDRVSRGGELGACSGCEVLYHEDCWQELGGCPQTGCCGLSRRLRLSAPGEEPT